MHEYENENAFTRGMIAEIDKQYNKSLFDREIYGSNGLELMEERNSSYGKVLAINEKYLRRLLTSLDRIDRTQQTKDFNFAYYKALLIYIARNGEIVVKNRTNGGYVASIGFNQDNVIRIIVPIKNNTVEKAIEKIWYFIKDFDNKVEEETRKKREEIRLAEEVKSIEIKRLERYKNLEIARLRKIQEKQDAEIERLRIEKLKIEVSKPLIKKCQDQLDFLDWLIKKDKKKEVKND